MGQNFEFLTQEFGQIAKAILFLKSYLETFNFYPLTLNQFSNGFLHRTLCFFHSTNPGPKTLHTALHTFSIFGPPTFGFWFQSAHEIPTRLKISVGGF